MMADLNVAPDSEVTASGNDSPEVSPAPSRPEMDFTSARHLYSLSDKAEACDISDQLQARLAHLSAMLMIVQGAGWDTFRLYREDIQHNYLWACSTISEECKELAGML